MNASRRALILAMASLSGTAAARERPTTAEVQPVPIATLAKSIAVRYDMFTLPNGLRVVVHTDRSVKTVGVTVEYAVGSSAEPIGKTGFAHLFEHLMFNGSENAPVDYSVPMQQLGATINGVTQYDRTAYYNDVPTPGLERTLFLESDRMGYLVGALNQTKLDEQRGVVQNEKRLGDDRPLGTMRSRVQAGVYPVGHPYKHDIIGSMADLDGATLDDVGAWFRAHYGPNNAILTLSGDIDVATARRLVTRYFGAIPAGPVSARQPTPVPTLARRLDETVTDRIPGPYLYRTWAVPGLTAPDAVALEVAVRTLSMESGVALRDRLTGPGGMFRTLSIGLEQFDTGGILSIHGPVAAGVNPAIAGRALDAAIAEAARTKPSAAAIERYLTDELMSQIRATADTGGGVGQIVTGLRLGQGPEWYRTRLDALVAQTPDSVAAAATRWLDRPAYALTVLPGAAPQLQAAAVRAVPDPAIAPTVVKGTRGPLPPVGTFADVTFPKAGHARLGNGIELVYLPNAGAPLTEILIDFDAGSVADPLDARGTQAMTLAVLDKGAGSRDAAAITRLCERMGAEITIEADADRTTASVSVPTANLRPGLGLVADMLRRPTFTRAAVEAARADIHGDEAERAANGGLANRIESERMNVASPYRHRSAALDPAVIDALTPAALHAFRNAWLRPDKATVYVISDAPLPQVRAALDSTLGDWAPTGPAGVKPRVEPTSAQTPGIVLIDRPGSDQAGIVGGQAVATLSPETMLAASVANTVLAGDGMGRIVRDLRETKGWSYNVQSFFRTNALGTDYRIMAPVQQNKTGASIALMRDHLASFVGAAPMTQEEFDTAIENHVRSMVVTFAGPRTFINAIRHNRLLGLPDDADAALAARYRSMTLDQARAAFRTAVDPATFVWIVSGDVAKVKPQLDRLGLPVTVVGTAPAEQKVLPSSKEVDAPGVKPR